MTSSSKNFIKNIFVACLCISLVYCKNSEPKPIKESTYTIDSIFSNHLNEYRKHNIYLPKGFNSEKMYPIIYATDGNSNITDKKMLLDSLIDNKIIKPVIFVASFSNSKIADSTSAKKGDGSRLNLSYRYFEYVKQYFKEDNAYPHLENRFEKHMQYFSEELIPQIEEKLNQNNNKNDRYFYGVSNGAGFGVSLLNKQPNLIGTYLCFSIFGGDVLNKTWDAQTDYPNLYLRYGSDEPFFLKDDAEYLKLKYDESNSFIEVKEFNGGHKDKFWKQALIEITSRLLKLD